MVLENPCYCGCLEGRCRPNANLRSLNTIRHPISGFQSRKLTCNTKVSPARRVRKVECKPRCRTNELNVFTERDFVCARIFNSFSIPNVPCICRKRNDPNLRFRTRPIPNSKNKCCNICLPDRVSNLGKASCCPPLSPRQSGDPAAFKPVQNVCLLCKKQRNKKPASFRTHKLLFKKK